MLGCAVEPLAQGTCSGEGFARHIRDRTLRRDHARTECVEQLQLRQIVRTVGEGTYRLDATHGFGHWRSLSFLVQRICTSLLDPDSEALDAVQTALESLRLSGYQMGITALYVLQCEVLLQRHQFARANASIGEAVEMVGRTGEPSRDNYRHSVRRALPRCSTSSLASKIATAL
jgi:hypothetical protein